MTEKVKSEKEVRRVKKVKQARLNREKQGK
jgi:hypothetical protein